MCLFILLNEEVVPIKPGNNTLNRFLWNAIGIGQRLGLQ